MRDLVIRFADEVHRDETSEVLCVEDGDILAARNNTLEIEKAAWIGRNFITIKMRGAAHHGDQPEPKPDQKAARWNDFLAGLEIVENDECRRKLAQTYLKKILSLVKQRRFFSPQRLWIMLPSKGAARAGEALRRAALTLLPRVQGLHILSQEVALGAGLTKLLLNCNLTKNPGAKLVLMMVSSPTARSAFILHADVVALQDLLLFQLHGWQNYSFNTESFQFLPAHAVDLILAEDREAIAPLLAMFSKRQDRKPMVLELSVKDALWEGLAHLLQPPSIPRLRIARLHDAFGFGFAEAPRVPLPSSFHNDGEMSQARYWAFQLKEDVPESGLKISFYSNCFGGSRVGTQVGSWQISGKEDRFAFADEIEESTIYCLGVSQPSPGRMEARLYFASAASRPCEEIGLLSFTPSGLGSRGRAAT